jgi:hypothetical protein
MCDVVFRKLALKIIIARYRIPLKCIGGGIAVRGK